MKPTKTEADFICMDCGVDTLDIYEFYSVEDKVWKKAVPDMKGMLCVGCLEKRLGRELTIGDFKLIFLHNINESNRVSERLYHRIFG